MKHSFGSDNHSGIAPEILQAISRANEGFQIAYGDDTITQECSQIFNKLFGKEVSSYFVFNGTGANSLSIRATSQSFNAILAPHTAHINVDECGAPEKMSGAKIIPIQATNGKISPADVKPHLTGFGFQHHSQVNLLSISQPTEYGTLYSKEEIESLAELIHSYGGYIHVDGSRIANAIEATGISAEQMLTETGVDVLSFGGTKNGLMIGEAVIFLNPKLAENFSYLRKQGCQLFSKSRFIAAQFVEYLSNSLYLKLASHSNNMAKILARELNKFEDVTISKPVETNAVFAILPKEKSAKLLEKHMFYYWDETAGEIRLMCSFNTTQEDIDNFINDYKSL